MALSDELKRIDFKDMANWPASFQLGVLCLITAVVVGLGYALVWKTQFDELEAGHVREEELKTQFIEKKQKAVNLAAYKQQLAEIKQTFEVLLKQLPRKSEMEALLTEINQAGVGRGLRFDLFEPKPEVKSAEMAELPISITLQGSYHDLAAFASDVSKLSRIVTINNLTLSLSPSSAGTPASASSGSNVKMQAVAKTYRYLDEEEQSAASENTNKGRSQ